MRKRVPARQGASCLLHRPSAERRFTARRSCGRPRGPAAESGFRPLGLILEASIPSHDSRWPLGASWAGLVQEAAVTGKVTTDPSSALGYGDTQCCEPRPYTELTSPCLWIGLQGLSTHRLISPAESPEVRAHLSVLVPLKTALWGTAPDRSLRPTCRPINVSRGTATYNGPKTSWSN